MSHRRTAIAVALVGALSFTACGESSYRYVADVDEKIYFKAPREWVEVDFVDSEPDRIEQLSSQLTLVWRAAVTTRPSTSLSSVDVDEPLAFSAVYELSGQLNQQMSASLARIAASPVGFDPVLPSEDGQGDTVEVLSYQPLDFPGINGSRILFRVRSDANSPWTATYDLSAAYDSQKFRLYVLQVGCSTTCYDLNERAISTVAGSWLVKK